jgi:hypothetical protein
MFYSCDYSEFTDPDDEPIWKYYDWSEVDRLTLRASIERGFLYQTVQKQWDDPKLSYSKVRLTAAGNDFVNRSMTPSWARFYSNVASNIPSILVSVLTALTAAWVLSLFGPV